MFTVQYSLIQFCTYNFHNNLTVIRLKNIEYYPSYYGDHYEIFLELSGKFLYFFKTTQCFFMKFCTYILAIALTVAKRKKSV